MSPATNAANVRSAPLAATGTHVPSAVPVLVPLDHAERLTWEAFKRCRRDVSRPQLDPHAENLERRFDTGRIRPHKHFLELLHNAWRRGAPRGDVEAPLRLMLVYVGQLYETNVGVDVCGLIDRALEDQSAATRAEFAAATAASPKTIADADDALVRVIADLETIHAALERQRCDATRRAA